MTSTRPDRLGAVGHGGDRLGAADAVHLVDTGHRRRGQRGVVDAPVGARRHAEDDLGDAGHPRRRGAHEHGRRVTGATARDVAAGPGDGPHQVADGDAVGAPVLDRVSLVGVVGEDPCVGHLERLAHSRRHPIQGRGHLGRRHPQVAEGHPVKPGRQLSDRLVPVLADPGQDLGHGVVDRFPHVSGARQDILQPFRRAAQVQALEHHEPPMLMAVHRGPGGPPPVRCPGLRSGIIRWWPRPPSSLPSPPPLTS